MLGSFMSLEDYCLRPSLPLPYYNLGHVAGHLTGKMANVLQEQCLIPALFQTTRDNVYI